MNQQPIRQPYGDIFSASTPNLDKLGDRLYKEQQAKDQQFKLDSKQMDDEFAKNMSGMKDIDIPTFYKLYGDYKQTWKDLNKNKDGIAPADQLNLLKKRADLYSHLTASKEAKAEEDQAAKDYLAHPDRYRDNAHQVILDRRNTPLEKFTGKNTDGTPYDKSDIYSSITEPAIDFSKQLKTALGTPADRGTLVTAETPLTKTITTYKAGASPSEFIHNLQASIVGDKKAKQFGTQFEYPEDKANQIVAAYHQLKETPEFKAAYPNEPEIPPSLLLTPSGRNMALMAMENAVLHPPVGTPKTINKTDAITSAKQAFELKKQEIGFQNALARQTHAHALKLDDNTPTPPNVLDEYTVAKGKTVINPVDGKPVTYVNEKDISPQHRPLFAGAPAMTIGEGETQEKVYVVNPDGSWTGANQANINPVAMVDKYTKMFGNSKMKLEARQNFKNANPPKVNITVKKGKFDNL